jgi:signal transduction histidine kinase
MACRDQSYAIPCRRYKAGDPREEGFCPTNAAGLCCFLLLANGSNAPQCCCRGGGRRVTTAAAPGVWVQTRLAEGLFPVHGDRVQLQQVVLNLLLNAVEAMGSVEGAPRELLISTEQDHTGVLVAVRDSGPGLDPSHLERVFDAFYTTKSSGMGMGLSICRSIIDAHGGRLWAEANEPRGAIFQFTLPAVPVGP